MDVEFDVKEEKKVIKLNATEEGLLKWVLELAKYHTHDQLVADFCEDLGKEL